MYVERSGNDNFIVNYLIVFDNISFIHISKVYKLYTFSFNLPKYYNS